MLTRTSVWLLFSIFAVRRAVADMNCQSLQTVPDRIRVAEAPDPLKSCCLVAGPGLAGFLFILTLCVLHFLYHSPLSLSLFSLSRTLSVSDLTILILTSVRSLTSQRDSERIRNKIERILNLQIKGSLHLYNINHEMVGYGNVRFSFVLMLDYYIYYSEKIYVGIV